MNSFIFNSEKIREQFDTILKTNSLWLPRGGFVINYEYDLNRR